MEIIPGTVEQAVEPSSTWVDVVYAQHLLDLYNSGSIANAAVFPSVLGAQTGDPRARYSNTALRPWFVVFDGDAGTWVNDGNTQWYDTNHYLAVVTDAEDVSPALSTPPRRWPTPRHGWRYWPPTAPRSSPPTGTRLPPTAC